MELKVKAYLQIKDFTAEMGEITLKDKKIVSFERHDNSKILEEFSKDIFPIKRSDYQIKFLDKYDEQSEHFNATIRLENKITFGLKLSWLEKRTLKSQLGESKWSFYLLTNKEWFVLIVGAIISAILGWVLCLFGTCI